MTDDSGSREGGQEDSGAPEPDDEVAAADGSVKNDSTDENKENARGESGKSESATAQEKAADPESARKWRSVGLGMDAALAALIGGGRANVFFGETSIGTLGDHYRSTTSNQFGVLIRSGTVSRDVLARIRDSYVEPTRYREIRQVLESQQAVFIRSDSGSGRTATALRLLDHVCRAGVRKLDPDVKLKTLSEGDLEDNHGYLLESLAPEQAQEFQAYHAEQLASLMHRKGCRLVVVVDRTTPLHTADIGHMVVDGLGEVSAEQLVKKHVAWGVRGSAVDVNALLDRPEVAEILSQVSKDSAHRELAELAALLVDVAHERLTVEALRERYLRADDAKFLEWFDQQADTDQRAFVIALAVFNNESVQLVSEAASWLADSIHKAERRRRSEWCRSVFEIPLQKRLDDARAEVVSGTVETRYGEIKLLKARFRDDRFPRKVLDHVCGQYSQAHEVVRDWLLKLGGIPGSDVRIRAGVAAGLLSTFDFLGIYNTVIEPWADSGDVDNRWAAVAALQIPGRHPEMARVVYRMLHKWIAQKKVPNRRVTAVQAIGSTEAMSPGAALRLLRYASRHANWDMAYAIGESLSELFCRVDDPGQVLRALVKWTDDDEYPERRETAFLSVLIISAYVVVPMRKSVEKWPVLIWVAEHLGEHRDLVVTLFSRMLSAAEFMQRGYLAMRRWLTVARKDKTLCRPIADLLFDIGEHSGELASIRYYVEYWGVQRGGPRDAAETVLQYLEEKGGST